MQKLVLTPADLNQNINLTANTRVLGLFKLKTGEQLQGVLNITHAQPNIFSRINIKAVIPANAKFDLQATVTIPQNASNSDTYLKVDSLLLSKSSVARVVPSLEIMNKEVKGGHGATVGKLDANQLHYLSSKGLSSQQANKLLIKAFTFNLEQQIKNET